MQKARKDFYKKAGTDNETMIKRLKFVSKFSNIYLTLFTALYVVPAFILIFSFLYWSYGLIHYYK